MNKAELIAKWEAKLQELNIDGLEILDKLFGSFAESERYTTGDAELLQQYRERDRKQKAEDAEKQTKYLKAVQERKEFEKTPLYRRNDTMRLLGHQCLGEICADGEYSNMLKELSEAHRYEWNFDIALDAYSLGRIVGIRQERKRRKEKVAGI